MKYFGLIVALCAFMALPEPASARGQCRNGVCRDRGAVRPQRPARPPARVQPTRPRNPRGPVADRGRQTNRPPRGISRPPQPRRGQGRYEPPRQRRHVRAPHRPVRVQRPPRVVYRTPRDYFRNSGRHTLYRNRWIRIGISHNDGFFHLDGRPYYVYNGYRHRYTPVEICDYELVDGHSNRTYETFYGQNCSRGYDNCADLRDELNWYEYDDRYFCAERFFDDPYRY